MYGYYYIYNCVYIYDFDIYIYILHFILGSFQKEGHRRLSKIRSVGDLGILRFKYTYECSTKFQWWSHFFLGRNCETSWSLELLKDVCFWPAKLGKENTILWGSKRERNNLFYFPSWNKQEVEWNCWKGGTCNSDKKEWKNHEMDCTLWLDGVLGQDCQRRTYRPNGVSSRL